MSKATKRRSRKSRRKDKASGFRRDTLGDGKVKGKVGHGGFRGNIPKKAT